MLRRFFFSTIFVSLFCLSLSVFADNPEQDSPDQNMEFSVNVTADRLQEPLSEKSDSVTVIDREEIERHQWQFVSDALRDVAGIAIVQSGSAGKTTSAFIRGAGSDQLLVLVDGIQTNDPYFGGVSLETLTTDNIERIEIVRGPQSTLYGSDAIGGVIHIITRGGEAGFQPHLSAEGGAFQTYREKAAISGGTDTVDYSVAFGRVDSDGQVENDELRQSTLSGKTTLRLASSTELSFAGRLDDSHIGIPSNASNLPSPLRNQDNQLSLLGATLHHSAGRFVNATARLSMTHIDSEFEDPEDPYSPFSMHISNVFQAAFQNNMVLNSQNTLSAGFEIERQRIDASDQNGPVPNLDAYGSEVYSAYVQNKYENGKWIFTAGIRTDEHSTFGNSVNPRVSAAYLLNSRWKLRGNFATGFRAPTAGDLLYPFYGNPDLRPEKSKSWEVGFDHSWNSRAEFSAVWYRNTYENLITFDPNTFLAGNVAEASAQGLELSAAYQLDRWLVSASYTYLDSKDEIENHRLLRRPANSGAIRISYDTLRWGSGIRILAVGNRLETDFRVFPTIHVFNPGYIRTDLTAFYRLTPSLKLQGRIENAFDSDYQEVLTFAAPGIALYGGIDFSL